MPQDEGVRLAVERFLGALEAMQVVDATADGRGGPLTTSPHFPGGHISLGGPRHMLGPIPGSPPPPPPPQPPPTPRFVRMVPGPEGDIEFYGGRLNIMGVELYDVGSECPLAAGTAS